LNLLIRFSAAGHLALPRAEEGYDPAQSSVKPNEMRVF
jgi:hypothetical protein